jgi:phosphoenolpyruvate-protein phosphotransferase (PTS system enzyme I)
MTATRPNRQLRGVGISPGFAAGSAYVHRDILDRDYGFYAVADDQIDEECARIERAFGDVLNDLIDLTRRVELELDTESADIFRAHKVLLRDASFRSRIQTELKKEKMNAEHAVKSVFERLRLKFDVLEDRLLRDHGDDVADLCKRLLRSLMGVQNLLEKLPPNAVLVAQRLLPSDTVLLRKHAVSAVVIEYCGTASHSAILARGMGIPVVSRIDDATHVIATGDTLLVDGGIGKVVLAPDGERIAAFERRAKRYRRVQAKARERCAEPALTQDGTRVFVMANTGCVAETVLASENGADGIGLFRLEQFFLAQTTLPGEKDIRDALCKSLSRMPGLPATIRLLDSGADKRLPYLKQRAERNPMLGRRGVRLLLEYPKLLSSQLRALLTVSQEHPLRILVPMVTLAEDMKRIRTAVATAARQLKIKNIPPVGAMIETPAAALCAVEIGEYADFFSLGTNDLAQYVMAAGRQEEFLSHYYIEDHPAVLRLMRQVCNAAPHHEIEVCGELAGNPRVIPLFLQMGIRHLSVLPLRIPATKEIIRTLRLPDDGASKGKPFTQRGVTPPEKTTKLCD